MSSYKGENFTDIFTSNRLIIIKLIINNKNITRTEISEITGLTLAAVSKIVSKLITDNIVLESHYVKGKSGRRSIGLQFNTTDYRVIGAKLSRKYFKYSVYDFYGTELSENTILFDEKQTSNIIESLIQKINHEIFLDPKIVSVGLAVPGPFNKKEGIIEFITTISNFNDINIREIFDKNINVPVFISQDANAAALAVQPEFNNMYTNNLVYYYLDQGVGAGVISSNNLITGSHGIAAEIGHVSLDYNGPKCECGNYGCLEKYCSSLSFTEETKRELKDTLHSKLRNVSNINSNTIFEFARLGDEFAIQRVSELAEYIAIGAINIINAYDPSIIIFDGEIMDGGYILRDKIQEVINHRIRDEISNRVTLIFKDHKVDYVLSGASIVAINGILKESNLFK